MKPIPLVDLKAQYDSIRPEIDAAISWVVERQAFVNGTELGAFEEDFAEFCGGGYCAGVGNGTDALELALRALEIGPGDEVITSAHTFVATLEAVLNAGATPVLVDCMPGSFLIDVGQVEDAVTPRTRAVIGVHIYGQPVDVDGLRSIASRHKLALIEDAAQAHGARYKDSRVGTLGDIAAFSFYPGKNLGGFGDGGAVVSGDARLVERVRKLRNHGRAPGAKFAHDLIGRNSRLDTIQAAVLNVKLKHLDRWNEQRRQVAAAYDELLGDSVIVPKACTEREHVYHLYVIQTDRRDRLREALKKESIATGIHYPLPVHLHSGIQRALGDQLGRFPVAEELAGRILSLPMFPEMTTARIERVAEAVRRHCASS